MGDRPLSYKLGVSDDVRQTLLDLRDRHDTTGPLFKITAIPGDILGFVEEALKGKHDDRAVGSYQGGRVVHYRLPADWFSGIEPVGEAHVLVGPSRASLFRLCEPESDLGPIRRAAETEAQGLI